MSFGAHFLSKHFKSTKKIDHVGHSYAVGRGWIYCNGSWEMLRILGNAEECYAIGSTVEQCWVILSNAEHV